MSLLFEKYWDNKLSVVYSSYGVWNAVQFWNCNMLDGYALTYHPFAAGTNLTLSISPPSVRIGQALVTMMLCVPQLAFFSDDDGTSTREPRAIEHFSRSLVTLGLLAWNYHTEKKTAKKIDDDKFIGDKDDENKNKTPPIPLVGRLLSGLLGLSQIGISIYFARHYVAGNPKHYEPFIINILTTTDHVPASTLTKDFLRGVYLAGTYAVSGIGWTLSTLLLKAVCVNSATECLDILHCLAINVSSQVIQHSIGYIAGSGGEALGDYMYVHGPMSAPALGMIFAAIYLVQPKTTK